MAHYKCPGCGMPYDGKKCRHCYYEHFSEEIAHGGHTHKGEPLVIRSATRKPIPRKDPFGCETKTKKKKNSRLPATLLALLIFFAEPVIDLAGELLRELEDTVSAFTVAQPEPAMAIPEDTMILYQGDGLCVRTDWKYYDSFGNGLSLYLENYTDRDVTVTAREVAINGYLMEYASLYCRAGEDQTGWGKLYVEEEYLHLAGITDIRQISFRLELYDSDTYDTIDITPEFLLSSDPEYVPVPNELGGMTILEQEGLRVSYLGYAANPDWPEEFELGKFLFHIENDTASYRQVMVTEGEPDIGLWCEVPPQTNAVAEAYLYGLQEQGIDSLEELPQLCFRLEVWDPEQQETVLLSEPITVSVP